jgi:hypothetical protein
MPIDEFRIEECMSSTLDDTTGAITLQVGDCLHDRSEDSDVPAFGAIGGILHRPAPAASKDAGAEVVLLRCAADTDIAIAGRDVRVKKIAGSLLEGETAVFASQGQARCIFKADGSITLYTTDDNTESGTSVAVTVGPGGVKVIHPSGVLTIDSGGVQIGESGGAFLKMSGNEITLSANKITIAGGSVALGMNCAPTNTVLYGPSGMAGIPSPSVLASTT